MSENKIYAALTEVFEEVFENEEPLTGEMTAEDVAGWDIYVSSSLLRRNSALSSVQRK
jgi:hypothetical protein